MEDAIKTLNNNVDMLILRDRKDVNNILYELQTAPYDICLMDITREKRNKIITYFIPEKNIFVLVVFRGKLVKIKESDYVIVKRVKGEVVEIRISQGE